MGLAKKKKRGKKKSKKETFSKSAKISNMSLDTFPVHTPPPSADIFLLQLEEDLNFF